ncbi:MAG: energy transducer TonB [Candidatus Zixiibacteriota bacterium]|nr:MAG: energy transducer TonB [candidate division Zixibacteria bacterium]
MMHTNRAGYCSYGAWELKATYQRNMLLGIIGSLALFMAVPAIFLLTQSSEVPTTGESKDPLPADSVVVRPFDDNWVIIPGRPVAEGNISDRQAGRFVNLQPMADEDYVADEDPVDLVPGSYADGPFPTSGETGGRVFRGDYGSGETDGSYPTDTEFVVCERYPEMVYKAVPEYPRVLEELGLEGVVWVRVLVDIDGSVKEARVARSSESAAFDEAALSAAYRNRFTPAIQSGRPVPIWVAYKVEFVLD